MRIETFTQIGVFLAWPITATALVSGRRGGRAGQPRARDPWGILGIVLQAAGMGIAWGWRAEGGESFMTMREPVAWGLAAVAVVLAWAAAVSVVAAVRALGKQWSLMPRLVEDHDLVATGPYAIVRHPIYTAFLGLLIATGFAFSTIEALAPAVALYLIGTWIRIRFEEKLLRGVFGERWAEYSRRVPPLLPLPRFRRGLAILLLAVAPLEAQEPAPPPAWGAFVRDFDAYVEAGGIVGASVLVVRDGRVVARRDVGFADRDAGRRVDENTIFHYGSITKTLTAIAVLQLRDRGLLSLDDPVTRWVPELRAVSDPYGSPDAITLHMLLSHTAGLQNPTWPWDEGEPWEPFEPTTWNQLVAMMPYQRLRFEPGTRYSYSNPAFIYLARVVELISGDPWEAYVQKNIFAPLGLSRSYFGNTPYYLAGDRSHNYELRADGASGRRTAVDEGADFDPGITIPNGGWNAPLDDVARYAVFLTGSPPDAESSRRYDLVLKRATLEEMWEPVMSVAEDGTGTAWSDVGLSFFIDRRSGRRVIGHTGSQANFRAFLSFDPEKRVAFLMVFNTSVDDGPDPGARELDALLASALRLFE
ncbi:MAG TPA: serine hydrolase [Gemmatimonadota bacterium]